MRSQQLSRFTRAAVLPLASAAFMLGAHAQSSNNEAGQRTAKPDAKPSATAPRNAYRAVRASEVIGMKVKNEKGENLGEIGDFIVNMNTGDLRYAILQFDPGIFTAEKLFAVQTKELKLGPDRKHVVYRMSKERLEKTSIDRSDWNRGFFNDAERVSRLDRASGITQPSEGARAHRVSDLIGRDVQSRVGENIGEIEDVVINMENQKVHYAVLHFDVGWATPDKRVVFPLRSFNVAQGKDELVLDVDKSKISEMKDFTKDNYANLDNPGWQVDVDRYLVTVVTSSNESRGSSSTMGSSGSQSSQGQGQQQVAQSSQGQGERNQSSPSQGSQPSQNSQKSDSQGSRSALGTQGSQGQKAQRGGSSSSAQSSEAMEKLQQSAQRLRESIQTMAQQEPGSARDRAIEQTHEALRETNVSMIALLPQLHGTGSSSSAKQASGAEYDKSVERLSKAADSLRQSIQAMAKQPAGEARTRAIEQANKALWETQEAMIAAYQQPGRSSSQTMGAGQRQNQQQGSK